MMERLITILCCISLTIFPIVLHSSDYTGFKNAHITYQKFLKDKPAGVYKKNGCYFFIVEISKHKYPKYKRYKFKMKAMLGCVKLMKKTAAERLKGNSERLEAENFLKNISLSSSLKKKLYSVSKTNNLKYFSYNGPSRILVNGFVNSNTYRYVAAVPVETFEKAISNSIIKKNEKQHELSQFLRNRLKILKEKADRNNKLAYFFMECGDLESAFAQTAKENADVYHLTVFPHSYLSNIEIYRRIGYIEKKLTKNLSTGKIDELLYILPGYPPVVARLAKALYEDKQYLLSNLFYFFALPGADNLFKKHIQAEILSSFKNLQKQMEKTYIDEYKRLYKQLFALNITEKNTYINSVFLSCGHIFFNTDKKNNQGISVFNEAKNAFEQGKDLKKIEKLIKKSITLSPFLADAWNYLGVLYKVRRQYKKAIICFNESIFSDPEYANPKVNIADCYKKLGLLKLHDVMMINALMAEHQTPWAQKKCVNFLQNFTK